MANKIENYRVVEDVDGFKVQIKRTESEMIGILWSRKLIVKEYWNNLNENGKLAHYLIANPPSRTKIYSSLEEAKKAIESFVKYPIYHYFKSDDNPPKFPSDK